MGMAALVKPTTARLELVKKIGVKNIEGAGSAPSTLDFRCITPGSGQARQP